jgi:thioredoxin 1
LQAVTDRQFDRLVESSPVPVLVEFWKPACGHCLALTTELEQVQKALGPSLLILAINVEDNPQIAAELEITSLPVLAFYRNGQFETFIGGLGTKDEILKHLVRELGP